MSWQDYVDKSLVGSGKIDQAAIFNAAGDSVWATSAGFSVNPDEIRTLVSGLKDTSPLLANGIVIAGQKYIAIIPPGVPDFIGIMGKKGKEGIVCAMTKQALLVAHHPDTVTTPDALGVVLMLKDYLVGVGY